jgi:transcriptional regulator with XRE-family HTH domain
MNLNAEPGEELRHWMGFVSNRIRHYREQANLTQQELADKAGLRQSHISRLEQGLHSPSSLTLEKIAAALGVSISELDPSLP